MSPLKPGNWYPGPNFQQIPFTGVLWTYFYFAKHVGFFVQQWDLPGSVFIDFGYVRTWHSRRADSPGFRNAVANVLRHASLDFNYDLSLYWPFDASSENGDSLRVDSNLRPPPHTQRLLLEQRRYGVD